MSVNFNLCSPFCVLLTTTLNLYDHSDQSRSSGGQTIHTFVVELASPYTSLTCPSPIPYLPGLLRPHKVMGTDTIFELIPTYPLFKAFRIQTFNFEVSTEEQG